MRGVDPRPGEPDSNWIEFFFVFVYLRTVHVRQIDLADASGEVIIHAKSMMVTAIPFVDAEGASMGVRVAECLRSLDTVVILWTGVNGRA